MRGSPLDLPLPRPLHRQGEHVEAQRTVHTGLPLLKNDAGSAPAPAPATPAPSPPAPLHECFGVLDFAQPRQQLITHHTPSVPAGQAVEVERGVVGALGK